MIIGCVVQFFILSSKYSQMIAVKQGLFLLFFLLSFFVVRSTSLGYTDISGSWCIDRLFKVTAYYTPVADQGVYFNGDYETEKKINWGNWYGASGRRVFNGMLAWPKWYSFGTTVYLSWYGRGWIYDRWWAIISTSWYDVIDIRAWSWLDGMVKALYWWSRSMTGTLCASWADQSALWFDRSWFPQGNNAIKTLLWTLNMQEWNQWVLINYLQSFLKQLWFFPSDQPLTSLFGSVTKQSLCKLQQEHLWVASDDEYCGYYGTKTRRFFAEMVKKGTLRMDTPSLSSVSKQPSKTIKKKRMITFK